MGSPGKVLDRSLGLSSVFSISVGAMLGSGIFVLPGLAAGLAGPYVFLSYMLAGLLVMPAAMSKAELATAMPVAGGTYVYVDRSLGPWMGTIAGLGTWFALSAKTAFALAGLGAYLALFSDVPAIPFALGVLTVLLALNTYGVGKAAALQTAIVFGTLAALIGFCFVGVGTSQAANFEPAFPHGAAGILAGAGFVFVSYNGVTKVCSVAEEVKDPERNIPLGMACALICVGIMYALLAYVITGNVPYNSLADDVTPVATVAQAVLGETGKQVLAGVAVVGLISMSNAGVLASSRFPLAMSRDALLPDKLAAINSRFGTPLNAILVTGVLLVMLVTTLPVVKLAKLASGFTIFIFCIVNVVVIVLRETGPKWYRPTFRSPLYPFTQILGILGGVGVLASLGLLAMSGVVGGITLGTAWYHLYGKQRVDRQSAFSHLWQVTSALEATEQAEAMAETHARNVSVVVPIFGGERRGGRLVRLAASFARTGSVEVLRFDEVPEQLNLAARLSAEDEGGEAVREAADRVQEDLDLPVYVQEMITHNAKASLLHHAEELGAEWIVLSPDASEHSLGYWVRHPMSVWFEDAPCNLAVFTDRGGAEDDRMAFERVLVVVEQGPHDALVMRIADQLAMRSTRRLTLLITVEPGASDARKQGLREYHHQMNQISTAEVDSLILESIDPYATVTEVSQDHDLLVIGDPERQGRRGLMFPSHEQRLETAASCSTLRVSAPRHAPPTRAVLAGPTGDARFRVDSVVGSAAVAIGVQADSMAALMQQAAERLHAIPNVGEVHDIVRVLMDREQERSSALPSGMALTAPELSDARVPTLGVFVLANPVMFGTQPVYVLVVCVAAKPHREEQLRIIEGVALSLLRTDLVARLRAAATEAEVRTVLLDADAEAEFG